MTIPFSSVKGSAIEDAVSIIVNGVAYTGWERSSISVGITAIANSFSFTMLDRWRQEDNAWPIRPGDKIEIYLGQEKICTGYVDALNATVNSGSREVEITGRSKAGDLVDCSADVPTGSLNGLRLDAIAKTLCKPFGISVKSETDIGGVLTDFSIKQGETVFAALDKAARKRGVLFISDADGNLIITKRGNTRAETEIVQGINFLGGSARYSMKNRFSYYKVKGQNKGTDNVFGTGASEGQGIATDEGVPRYRPKIIIAEQNADTSDSQKRAAWENSVRVAQGSEYSVDVQSFFQKPGVLWKPNQLVVLRVPFLGILEQELLIANVTYSKSTSGTISTLDVGRPDAYDLLDKAKKEDDPLAVLGWDRVKSAN